MPSNLFGMAIALNINMKTSNFHTLKQQVIASLQSKFEIHFSFPSCSEEEDPCAEEARIRSFSAKIPRPDQLQI